MFILPTSAANEDDDYNFEVELDGVTFVFDMHWNDRAGAWFMSLSKTDGTKLVSGIRVTSSLIPLSWYVHTTDAPKGRLFLFESSGTGDDPGRFDLAEDQRCQLCYYEQAEWEALLVTNEADLDATLTSLGLAP